MCQKWHSFTHKSEQKLVDFGLAESSHHPDCRDDRDGAAGCNDQVGAIQEFLIVYEFSELLVLNLQPHSNAY